MSQEIEKFFSLSMDMLCIASTDGYFKRVNPAFERTLGWLQEELLRRPFIDFVHPDDVDATLKEVDKLGKGVPTISFENRYICTDGTYKNLVWTCFPEASTGILHAVARDVTELKRAQEQFRLAIEASPTAMLIVDASGEIVFVNRSIETLFGYNRDELAGQKIEVLLPESLRASHPTHRKVFFSKPTARPMGKGRDLTAKRKDGSEFPVEIGLNPVQMGDVTYVITAIIDLTWRKNAENKMVQLTQRLKGANRRLTELASTDSLTGLKNRRVFFEEIRTHLRLARREGRSFSVLLADIDRFKQYNDSFGHPAGDDLIRAVGQVLHRKARRSDIVARYGGEEFIVGMPETDMVGAFQLGERFRKSIEGKSLGKRDVTCSFGVSTASHISQDVDESGLIEKLIAEADKALYHSKKGGRNRVTHARILKQM